MAYDGFYANLSTRGSVNEILNQADRIKEDLVPIADGMEDAKRVTQDALTSIDQSKLDAKTSADTALTASTRAKESELLAKRYADAATYKFATINVPTDLVPVKATKTFNVVTTTFPCVFYQTRVVVTEATDTVLYDIEATIGNQVVYRAEAVSGDLKDSIPFYSDSVGLFLLKITNKGRSQFKAAITSTYSQVGNA